MERTVTGHFNVYIMKKNIFVRFTICLISLFTLVGCTPMGSAFSVFSLAGYTSMELAHGPKKFYGEGYTAVVVAYAPEMEGILEAMEADPKAGISNVRVFNGVTYRSGTYHDKPILVFATGMSIANAAMTTQMALDYFPINELVFMGIAGGVNPAWQPGDVVIPERWYYHDESVYCNPDYENFGSFIVPDYYRTFLKEQPSRRVGDPNLPNYKPFGFVHPSEVEVMKDGMAGPKNRAYFSATPRLLEAAGRALEKMPPQFVSGEREAVLTVGGNGVTGSVFVDNREYRKWTREVFDAEVTDMESAAIGQVCYINDVDWVIIRAISDLAGGQEGVNVENIYDEKVSRIGARVLFAVLDELLGAKPAQ
jgi:adenosylhomocysteine nucleosidase